MKLKASPTCSWCRCHCSGHDGHAAGCVKVSCSLHGNLPGCSHHPAASCTCWTEGWAQCWRSPRMAYTTPPTNHPTTLLPQHLLITALLAQRLPTTTPPPQPISPPLLAQDSYYNPSTPTNKSPLLAQRLPTTTPPPQPISPPLLAQRLPTTTPPPQPISTPFHLQLLSPAATPAAGAPLPAPAMPNTT